MDLLARGVARDAVAVLMEGDVPVADALEVARELRGVYGPGRVVETVRRSGKFGAQLNRLEGAGFSAFVLVRVEDGGWSGVRSGRWRVPGRRSGQVVEFGSWIPERSHGA